MKGAVRSRSRWGRFAGPPRRQLVPMLPRFVAVLLTATVLITSCTNNHGPERPGSASPTTPVPSGSGTPPGSAKAPMFAMYYLWWDRQHWVTHLGGAYPAGNARDPLPAKLDTAGCSAKNLFPGNVLTDISQGLRYDQATPGTISRDVQLAARAGLSGFAVNWIGTGLPNQGPGDNSFNTRLSYLFAAVHKLNAAGTPFSVILNYQSSAKALTVTQFSNDFDYFLSKYGADSTLDHHFSKLPEVIMAGTWKYSDGELASISKKFRNRMYLLGDEKPASWNAVRAQYLDGTSYYWSSQDPIKNRSPFIALERFAVAVRRTPNPDGSPKTWLAPFTPGYNAMLLYHTSTCVPRDNGQTMKSLFAGNSASKPDGWTLISWNEISEGSYVVPLTRYGMEYLDTLRSIADARR